MARLVKELLATYLVCSAIFVVALTVVGAVALGLAAPAVLIANLASRVTGIPADILAVIGLAGFVVSVVVVNIFDKLTRW